MLGLLGDVIEIDEELIDAATALMGCSPGYLALMAEILVEEGVKEGLREDQALRMVARSMAATGGLLDLHKPERAEAGGGLAGRHDRGRLDALEERSIRVTLQAAVDASLERVRG